MADISAEYTAIAETSGKMATQCNIIVDEIYNLLGRVGTLLDSGLYLEQASPALKTAYEEFSRSMHMAATGIQGWANLLTTIVDSFKNNDADLFAATLSGIDGKGGFEMDPEKVESPTDVPKWNDSNNLGGTPISWNDDRSSINPTGSIERI